MLSRLKKFNDVLPTLVAMATVGAGLASVVYLATYLAVFDFQLITIIEYGDLFKAAFVATSFMAGVFFFGSLAFIAGSYNIDKLLQTHQKYLKFIRYSIYFLFIVQIIYYIIAARRGHTLDLDFTFSIDLGIWFIYILIFQLVLCVEETRESNPQYERLGFVYVICLVIVGQAAYVQARYVQRDGNWPYVVEIKDRESISGLKIVSLLSHHNIFASKEKLIVVPASEVRRIERTRDGN